jgi:uncharacterized LabA/DUF88 family protein
MGVSSPPVRPVEFQRAMVFVDGTNLFYRLEAFKLRLRDLGAIAREVSGGRQILRIYLYTTAPHYEKARRLHGDGPFQGARVVLGEAVPTGDGNVKEKGVDALLVADLVYHAASKNYDFGILVSVDTDFALPLKRVEDFGCRTAVIGLCTPIPESLKQASDEAYEFPRDTMVNHGWAENA